MAATIRDIAKAAGVSVATVSKVLNGYTTVSDKTREKVMRIVGETRFHPNSAARELVGQRSNTLGIYLTTGVAHPYFIHILSGIEQGLKDKGYDLIYLARMSWDKDYSFVRHCRSRNVEGVVVFGFQDNDMNFAELIESEIPAIFIDQDMTGSRVGYIASDNVEAIRRVIRYLRDLKHRRIGIIAGSLESYVGQRRHEGFRKGLAEYGLTYRPEYVVTDDFTREGGYGGMKKLLSLAEPPTAVICSSDMSAIGAMEAIRDAGLSVPADISVVGFDDIDLARHVSPALTTVRQNAYVIGRKAIELLNDMLRIEQFPSPSAVVPTELIVRESCGPAKE